jgi:hypothetical protein
VTSRGVFSEKSMTRAGRLEGEVKDEVKAALARIVAELEAAISQLEPPFLALPERGETAEALAYLRGARHAYQTVIAALEAITS